MTTQDREAIEEAFRCASAAILRPTTLPEISHCLDVLKARVLAALSTRGEDAKDAARYRWLREQDWFEGPLCVLRDPKRVLTQGIGLGADCPSHHRLDAAIDSAISHKG